MHILIILLAAAGVFYLLWSQYHQKQQAPALPAPLSPFERDVLAQEFQEMVLTTSHEKPVMVDFYASWCGPCHMFAPVLAEAAREYGGAFLLARIDYDKSYDLVREHKVSSIPTIALFRNGEKVDGFEGGQLPHQLRYFLAKNGINPASQK